MCRSGISGYPDSGRDAEEGATLLELDILTQMTQHPLLLPQTDVERHKQCGVGGGALTTAEVIHCGTV
jgi:hypothetical protein